MNIVAYLFRDVLLGDAPHPDFWGWDVDRVYRDECDPAGASPAPRPQLLQLLHDSETDPPDYVLIRQLDDLGEDAPTIHHRLTTLEQRGCQVVAIDQPYATARSPASVADRVEAALTADLPPFQQALLTILMDVQQHQHHRRLRRGHAQNRLQALPPPGKAPYGYRRGKERYAIDRSTAPVVKEFFEQFLLYGSLRGAVRHIRQRYGKSISPSTGKRWLSSPVYRGDLAYIDGTVIRDTHAPIISRLEAAQVDRLLRRNQALAPRTASSPRSLSGLVYCAQCQSGMTVTRVTQRQRQTEYLYLRPVACPRQPRCRSLRYEQVLEQTIQTVCRDLPAAVAQLHSPPVAQLQQQILRQITEKQTILAQLPELLSAGILDQATVDLRAYRLKAELSDLARQQEQLPPVNLQATAQTVSIPQFWHDLTEAERRFYFREFIRRIELDRPDQTWDIRLSFVF